MKLSREIGEQSHLPAMFQQAAKRMVVARLDRFGWANRDTVAVIEYQQACTAACITRDIGWEALLEQVDVPGTAEVSVQSLLLSSE